MYFTRIALENFGIFYGRQEIDLKKGLYVFSGPNGRGKTTIVNAVKWAFFRSFEDRQGRSVQPEVILNRDAEQEGKDEFLVEIEMKASGKAYLLRRGCKIQPDGSSEPDLFLSVDGEAQSKTGAEARLEQLLNQRISRFFLFDGEELRRYEELLFDDDDGADLIRESIEQILGLPILSNGAADLSTVSEGLEKRKDKLAKKEKKAEKFALQAEQLSAEIESKKSDIEDLRAEQGKLENEVAGRDKFLQKYENSLDELKHIEGIESELSTLESQRLQFVEDRTDALATLYVDVLDRAIAGDRETLMKRAEAEQQREAEIKAAQGTLNGGACKTCGHDLSTEERKTLEAHLSSLESENGGGVSVAQVMSLSAIAGTGAWGRVKELDQLIAQLSGTKSAKQEDLEARRAALQKLPEDEVGRAQKSRDQAHQSLGALKQSIAAAQGELSDLDQELKTARKNIGEVGTSDEIRDLQAQVEIADQIRTLFETSRTLYRDELKSSIEKDATEIFLKLRHEESFTALKINDHYGLDILDHEGKVVTGRSAGQEQVVALALIGALNRNAMREAPVVMDTPFGRLDPIHRENILNFVPEMADQVFLLVHSGEVSDEDLSRVQEQVEEVIELHRAGADRTELRFEKN